MSVQFAKNETVIRSYEYATSGTANQASKSDFSKRLIITDKRLIHQEVCERRGKNVILRQEMPIADAKYLNVSMARISSIIRLVLAIIFAVLGTVAILLPIEDLKPWTLIGGGAGIVVALIFLIAYFCSFHTVLAFSVSTDHHLQSVVSVALSDEGESKKKNQAIKLQIRINKSVAQQMADELGSVLLMARDYKPEEQSAPAAETPAVPVQNTVSVEAPVCKIEEATEEVAEASAETWVCSCGQTNYYDFCSECGKKKD